VWVTVSPSRGRRFSTFYETINYELTNRSALKGLVTEGYGIITQGFSLD